VDVEQMAPLRIARREVEAVGELDPPLAAPNELLLLPSFDDTFQRGLLVDCSPLCWPGVDNTLGRLVTVSNRRRP
jgi:hypothetical protein